MWLFYIALICIGIISYAPGIPSGRIDTITKDFEQAKLDCENQNGLKSVATIQVNFRPNKVIVNCNNGIKVSRNSLEEKV